MRNRFSLLFFLAVLLLFSFPAHAAALEEDDIAAEYAILIEANTNTVLFEKNADARAYPASTTKVMTALLTLEQGNLDATVKVPSVTNRGSLMGIRRGETMSLRSLLYGMMLVSGNDSAEAIAMHVGGTEEAFIARMNEKASELNLKNTHFVNPHGMHKEEHYTTARDFAELTRHALLVSPEKDNFRAVVKRSTYTVDDSSRKSYLLENTNKLIHTRERNGQKQKSFEYRNAVGVKTGDTPVAEKCLVAAAERNGALLIAVLFKQRDSDQRFVDAAALFDYGFSNFQTVQASELGLPLTMDIEPHNGNERLVHADLTGITVCCSQSELEAYTANPGGFQMELKRASQDNPSLSAAQAEVVYLFDEKTLFTAPARIEEIIKTPAPVTVPSTIRATPPPVPEVIEEPSGLFIYIVLGTAFLAGCFVVVRKTRVLAWARTRMQGKTLHPSKSRRFRSHRSRIHRRTRRSAISTRLVPKRKHRL